MKKRIIVLIGPEGSGKSTQSRLLTSNLHLPHIATGDILRQIQQTDTTSLGIAVRNMFDANRYLESKYLFQALEKRLDKKDTENGFVLDGGMRTVEEINKYPSFLKKIDRDFEVIVIKLIIKKEESIKRLIEGRKRIDDTQIGITKRLHYFYKTLKKREKMLKKFCKFIEIDGLGSKAQVHQKIREKLSQL